MTAHTPAPQEQPGTSQAAPTSDGLLAAIEKITRELDALRGIGTEQHHRATEVLSREAEIAARLSHLDESEKRLAARERDLSAAGERLAALHEQLSGRETALKASESQFAERQSRLTEVEEQAASAQRLLDAAEQELSDASDRLVARSQELAGREESATRREAEVEARARAIAAREAELIERASGEAAAASREISQLNASIDSLRKENAELEGLRSQLIASDARAASLESRRRESDELRAAAADRAQAAEAGAQLLRTKLAEVEQQLAAARDVATAQSGGAQAEILKRDKAIDVLRERLHAAESRGRQLEEEVEAAQQLVDQAAAPRSDASDFLDRRRTRLRRQRALLEERARKIIRAKDALAQRASECDAILAQRTALGNEMAALADQQRVIRARAAKRSAGALVASAMVTLAASLGAAWPIAGLIAEPTYQAHARMGMEKAGGEPSRASVESWTAFHQALVKDPQFLEQAAEKLKRRGFDEVGTASTLKARLDRDLQFDPAAEGEIGLTFRGAGSARTQGILEAFSSALAGAANDTRERRMDRASTFMLVKATAGEAPFEDPRLGIYGVVAVALLLMAAGAGFVAWRVFSKRAERQPAATIAMAGDPDWTIGSV